MAAHDLSKLLTSYGRKICTISHNLVSYVYNRCAVVCFDFKKLKDAVIGSLPVFKSMNLHWAGFSLACCAKCEQFGHIFDVCLADGNSDGHVFFGGKTWIQIAGGFSAHAILSDFFGAGVSSDAKLILMIPNSLDDSCLVNYLVSLKCFLELLSDQISIIMKKLSFVELVLLANAPHVFSLVTQACLASNLNLDMTLNNMLTFFISPLLVVVDTIADFSLSNSKVLTTKTGGLESKIMALKVFSGIRVFSSGLDKGFLGAGVTIIMNASLAYYVYKIFEVPGWLLFIKLLFKNKLFVLILGFYAGAFLAVCFFQAGDINSLITQTVNESSFIILGKDFNNDDSSKFNVMVNHNVLDVGKHFDTDHQVIFVSVEIMISKDFAALLDTWNGLNAASALVLLDYVFDGAFFSVMCPIGFDEMFAVVLNLPNEKTTSFFGIPNKL
ncbi:hypothetical protein G9A89_020326 [Geosiphon pyriformis]|nr:hypothetical protein G9A89_020326 [Geosiphon pyriformis]